MDNEVEWIIRYEMSKLEIDFRLRSVQLVVQGVMEYRLRVSGAFGNDEPLK